MAGRAIAFEELLALGVRGRIRPLPENGAQAEQEQTDGEGAKSGQKTLKSLLGAAFRTFWVGRGSFGARQK
jgi:hypothetical protein